MTDNFKTNLSNTTRSVLPWQKGIAWWIVLLEGLLLVAIGLWMYFSRPTTFSLIGWLLSFILVLLGSLNLYPALKSTEKSQARMLTTIHGLIALVAGLIGIIFLLFAPTAVTPGLYILGAGYLGFGGFGLFMSYHKDFSGLRNISLAGGIVWIIMGVLLLLQAFGTTTLVTLIFLVEMLLLIIGTILIIWAFILKNESKK